MYKGKIMYQTTSRGNAHRPQSKIHKPWSHPVAGTSATGSITYNEINFKTKISGNITRTRQRDWGRIARGSNRKKLPRNQRNQLRSTYTSHDKGLIGSRAIKETATAENVRLFGLFRCGFHNARTNSDIFVELSESLDNQTVVSAFHVFNRMDLLQLPVALKTLRQSGFDCPEITQQIWDEARKACTQVGDLVLEIPE